MNTNNQTPRIYVACLASYNAGELHGAWVDLDSDKDVMGEAIASMLATSPTTGAEDYAIHNTENLPSCVGEYTSLDDLATLAELYDEHGDAALAALEEAGAGDLDDVREALEDCYVGEYDNDEDFAYSMAEDMGLLQDNAQWPYTCIDWGLAARELMYDYFAVNWNGTRYYFRNQ